MPGSESDDMKRCCGLRGQPGHMAERSGFHKDAGKSDGLASMCKACKSAYNAAYREADLEKEKARHAAYREANPEKLKARRVAKRSEDPKGFWRSNAQHSARQRSRVRGTPFTLELEDIDTPDTCPAYGTELDYNGGKGRGSRNDSPVIAELEPRKGYTRVNTVTMSAQANNDMGRLSVDGLRHLANVIEQLIHARRHEQQGEER